jgi:peptide/nickel transport system substrate-binding protein
VFQYVYPSLTQYDKDLNIVPYFAQRWEKSDDGLTWTFHTVPDAKWSDGNPLTAADVKWTIDMLLRLKEGPTADTAGLVRHVTNVEVPDPNTVVLTYEQPVANVLSQMQELRILPKQVWEEPASGDGEMLDKFENGAPMVSGGPFKLVKYTKGQIALFDRNPNWWGQKPHIEGFGLQFFSNDDAMVTALKTGQVDMIGEYTPPTAIEALKKANMVVLTAPSASMKNIIINSNPDKQVNRELLDPKVRQAMEHAIDRDEIIKTAWLGYATPGSTMIAPASGWHNDAIKGLPFDLGKANQLLDEAGYTKGADGIRVADGHRMDYQLIFATDERGAGDRAFQIIQNNFAKIGIKITQQVMDGEAAWTAIVGPDEDYPTYDLAMWDWVPPLDPQFILSVVTCDSWGFFSDSGYCDSSYDEMFLKQGTLTDPAERHAFINEMQQKLFDDRPYIILNYPHVIEAHSPKWDGFVLSPVMGSVNSLSTETLLNVHQVG